MAGWQGCSRPNTFGQKVTVTNSSRSMEAQSIPSTRFCRGIRLHYACTPAHLHYASFTVPAKPAWVVPGACSRRLQQVTALCAAPADIILPSVTDAPELESQQKWLAGAIELWLNDEWTKLDIHRELGEATAQAYGKARLQGSDEIGEVLLSIGSDLLAFNFRETFVNAFDVANKAAELLMQDMGQETCCG